MATLTKSARDNFTVCILMLTLASASTFIRILMRLTHHHSDHTLLAADWMCLVSLCVFAAYCALIINFIFNTSQFHAFDLNPAYGLTELVNIFKMSFIAEILFGTSLTSIKLSILLFYDTLFSINDKTRGVTRATAALCIIWYLIVTFIIVFQCEPISAYWESTNSAMHCRNSPTILLGYEISNLFLDVTILCIPITIVPRLQLSTVNKVTVLGIFLIGALVCVCSILRLTAIWNPPNVVQNFKFSFTYIWATMQLGLGITCGCLPTFGTSLLQRVTSLFGLVNVWFTTIKIRSAGGSMTDQHSVANSIRRPWVKVGDDRRNAESRTWAFGNNNASFASDIPLSPIPPRSIVVNRELEIV
ncbi:hypothetical protein F5Y02DRAFT_232304 [Annulohypoxylon stygium]|nr:hypothetical protein F5Y02DRAFT_232304 [Annulohypoxylon stygium]